MTRTIPSSLSPILTELELDAPQVVTLADLTALVRHAGIATEPKVVADRLRKLGWLLPTETAGVWEFAPAAHAGPIGHGDLFLGLRAALAARPSLEAAVCLASALQAHGLTDRAPDRLEVAVRKGTPIPAGLRRATRVVVFAANLAPERSRGVPVHRPPTILVHLADRPADVRGWGTIADALPELVTVITPSDVDDELASRPRSVRVRLAYLIQGVAPDLADRLVPPGEGGRSAPKVWFGPRGTLKRHSARFSIADTLLPFDPASLHPA
ncbi:MAG: type IV toxin-antitoxin system AbiEi family antitoxin [Steroidobacteraceae bacterium]